MDKINWICADCLNASQQLPSASDAAAEQVHAAVRRLVDELLARASGAGYSREEAAALAYPVVALLDEMAMQNPGRLREVWSRDLLQLRYFRDNLAGEHFFVHLEEARRAPPRTDLLRVYYLALSLGFQGRYRVRGGERQLAELTERVHAELREALPAPDHLSPDGLRPREAKRAARAEFPYVWLSAGLMALAVMLYAGFQVVLREQARSVLGVINQLAGG